MTRTSDIVDSLTGIHYVGTVISIIVPGQTTDVNGYKYTHQTYKLQVRVPALHDGIPDNLLPYCTIMRPVFRGMSSNVGIYNIPRVGSQVVLIFEAGASHTPIVIGELWVSNVQTSSNLLPNGSGENVNSYGTQDEHGNITAVGSDGSITQIFTNDFTLNVSGNITIQNGSNVIQLNGNTLTISVENVIINGDLVVNGTSTTNGDSSVQSLSINGSSYTAHVHSGVASGPNNTGPVV